MGMDAVIEFFAVSELITTGQRTFVKIEFFIIFLLLIFLLSTIWFFGGDPLDLPARLLPLPTLVMLSSGSLLNQLVRLALGQLGRSLTLQKELMGKPSLLFLLTNPKHIELTPESLFLLHSSPLKCSLASVLFLTTAFSSSKENKSHQFQILLC